jgi:RNA polymerase primary sigma factor
MLQSLEQTRPDGAPQRASIPPEFWYVSDERIRTPDAARLAVQVARWAATRTGLSTEPDEQTLFTALHTCAFNCERTASKRSGLGEHESWRDRWKAIREHLVEKNLGLAHICCRRFRFQSMDEDDVLSEAMCGLGRAIDRFNPWRGFRFSTYACNVIGRALMRRGKSESRYRHAFPVQHDDSYERATEPPDSRKELCLDRLRVVLDRNLGELTDLEATVLSHRFCRDPHSELTYQEIGKLIGLSKERVRQIQNAAIRKLRAVLDSDPVLE